MTYRENYPINMLAIYFETDTKDEVIDCKHQIRMINDIKIDYLPEAERAANRASLQRGYITVVSTWVYQLGTFRVR